MPWRGKIGLGLALVLSAPAVASAQYPPTVSTNPTFSTNPTLSVADGLTGTDASDISLPPLVTVPWIAPAPVGDVRSVFEDPLVPTESTPVPTLLAQPRPSEPKLGPYPVDQVKFLQNALLPADSRLKIYGWLETEYTYRSTGPGRTTVAPVMDRFGNEFLLRQLALRIERPLNPNDWSWGFNMQPYAGSDPAFLNPIRGAIIDHPNPRFGFDFSDLNLTAHLPILTEGGVDLKAGRQTTVIGSQAAQAPWRIFASSDYQWYIAQEGRYTGVSGTWHVHPQLDLHYGLEMGWGTFFENLSVAPTHIAQVNYWLQEDKRTKFTATLLTGPERPHYSGNTTVVELRVTQNWNRHLTQIVQSHIGYSDGNIFGPLAPKEHFGGLWNIFSYHVDPLWDVNFRTEWYDDVNGGGYPGGFGPLIGPNNYYEVTLGLDHHPTKWLQIRPEIRGDFADRNPAFGAVDRPGSLRREQLTLALEMLIKF